jgi:hypothetical protein
MEPTVRVGERVRIRAVPRSQLRVGDVVLFEGGHDDYILHRIVLLSPRRRWFLHTGDAPTPAGPRRALCSRIVGRAELPRRPIPPQRYLEAARTFVLGVVRRLRGR